MGSKFRGGATFSSIKFRVFKLNNSLFNSSFIYFFQIKGPRSFSLSGICRFCYQTPEWLHMCNPLTNCRRDSWIRLHKVNCSVSDTTVCLGARQFFKKVECNWTSGYKWSVTMLLSIFLGGFGADRFYLGHYKVIKQNTTFLS